MLIWKLSVQFILSAAAASSPHNSGALHPPIPSLCPLLTVLNLSLGSQKLQNVSYHFICMWWILDKQSASSAVANSVLSLPQVANRWVGGAGRIYLFNYFDQLTLHTWQHSVEEQLDQWWTAGTLYLLVQESPFKSEPPRGERRRRRRSLADLMRKQQQNTRSATIRVDISVIKQAHFLQTHTIAYFHCILTFIKHIRSRGLLQLLQLSRIDRTEL